MEYEKQLSIPSVKLVTIIYPHTYTAYKYEHNFDKIEPLKNKNKILLLRYE